MTTSPPFACSCSLLILLLSSNRSSCSEWGPMSPSLFAICLSYSLFTIRYRSHKKGDGRPPEQEHEQEQETPKHLRCLSTIHSHQFPYPRERFRRKAHRDFQLVIPFQQIPLTFPAPETLPIHKSAQPRPMPIHRHGKIAPVHHARKQRFLKALRNVPSPNRD